MFKVGDKVRIIELMDTDLKVGVKVGDEFEVREEYYSCYYGHPSEIGMYSDQLELVKKEQELPNTQIDLEYLMNLRFKAIMLDDFSGGIVDWFEYYYKGYEVCLELRPAIGYKGSEREHSFSVVIYGSKIVDSLVFNGPCYKALVNKGIKIVHALTE